MYVVVVVDIAVVVGTIATIITTTAVTLCSNMRKVWLVSSSNKSGGSKQQLWIVIGDVFPKRTS